MNKYEFVVVVDNRIDELQKYLNRLAVEGQVLSINQELSAYLSFPDEDQTLISPSQFLVDRAREIKPLTVIFSDIDFLFHPSLSLDPVAIFHIICRFTNIIVLWPGTYNDGVLTYAIPEHSHYRFWKDLDGIVIKGVSDAF